MVSSDYPTFMLVWLSWSDPPYFKSIPKKIQPLIQHWKKIDLFLQKAKCGALCTYKERVDKDDKCPVILQCWSWPKNCNCKSGQHWTHCCPHQPVPACPQFRIGRKYELPKLRLLQAFSAMDHHKRAIDDLRSHGPINHLEANWFPVTWIAEPGKIN